MVLSGNGSVKDGPDAIQTHLGHHVLNRLLAEVWQLELDGGPVQSLCLLHTP